MPFHYAGAYDGFDSLDEVREHYRRCRKIKDFIMSDAWVKANDPVCAACGKKFSEHSRIANAEHHISMQFQRSEEDMLANRCHYNPRTGKIAIMQYVCAWKSLLGQVFALADRLY